MFLLPLLSPPPSSSGPGLLHQAVEPGGRPSAEDHPITAHHSQGPDPQRGLLLPVRWPQGAARPPHGSETRPLLLPVQHGLPGRVRHTDCQRRPCPGQETRSGQGTGFTVCWLMPKMVPLRCVVCSSECIWVQPRSCTQETELKTRPQAYTYCTPPAAMGYRARLAQGKTSGSQDTPNSTKENTGLKHSSQRHGAKSYLSMV